MSKNSPFKPLVSLITIALLWASFFLLGRPAGPAAAQSTGDTLPTRAPTATPTRPPTAVPTLTPTPADQVWLGRLVSNTPGFTKGGGSIFRVNVTGLTGARIELRSSDYVITGESGSKPEYGPYAAEFAPVTPGVWTMSVPALGVSFTMTADGYNLAVIEFTPVTAPEATRAALPSATPTALSGQVWAGRVVSETYPLGVPFARLLVQVVGRDNQPVQLSTLTQPINTANTGQKPAEFGPNTVEFTGLTPGKYFIEPLGLNCRLEVELKPNVETRAQFSPVTPPTSTLSQVEGPPPTVTPTPGPPTVTLTPTATPSPTLTPTPTPTPTPTVTPTPTFTPTPLPSPTPVTRWLGVVAERKSAADGGSQLTVRVSGLSGVPVRLRPAHNGGGSDRRCITGQGTAGQDICAFKDLSPGNYLVTPEGLNLSLPVTLFAQEQVSVWFDLEVLPAGITGWQARLQKNTNGPQALPGKQVGIIRVWVAGQTGQIVALRSVRGTDQVCEVAPNPILGGLACEFGPLGPGVYLVEAVNTGVGLRLFVDGAGLGEVIFSPNATYATQALAQLPAAVGQGAQPVEAVTPTPTAAAARPTPRQPTATPSPTVTPTATPAFAWQGRVVETVNGMSGTIAARAAGLKDHPVVLRSGGWQSMPQLTGSKSELGDYAVEFGGLAQGEYIVELVDLAAFKVKLGPDQFILVEFRYDFVNPAQK